MNPECLFTFGSLFNEVILHILLKIYIFYWFRCSCKGGGVNSGGGNWGCDIPKRLERAVVRAIASPLQGSDDTDDPAIFQYTFMSQQKEKDQ